jgi:uncharacterized protein (DUF1501 family)
MPDPIAAVSGNGDQMHTLMVVFLRGAADGLTLVPPVGDDNYYRSRPRINVPRHDAVPLDGFFALHSLLKPLKRVWDDGHLAIVHAAGSEDDSRSHFDAQDFMEHGGVAGGGWLGRFLRFRDRPPQSPLSAVALGKKFPECLRGAPSVTVMQSTDDFSLSPKASPKSDDLVRGLARLYAAQQDLLAAAGRDTLNALARIERMRSSVYRPEHGAEYGKDSFSLGLRQAAQLIKAQVGLEAVSLDLEGWDSHFTQSTIMNPLMVQLATGLTAFYADLGPAIERTTVMVMTEFGRRVQENSSFGTDHGMGSVMLLMGGGIRGGRVIGKWPGLAADFLTGPGDLQVVHNYRNVLAPILMRQGAAPHLHTIFPDFPLHPLDVL